MSGYLPPGITDAMLEPYDPPCGTCGHEWSMHYEPDEIVYDADGNVIHACDAVRFKDKDGNKIQCECEVFNDDEYEPNEDDYHYDL